LACEALKQRPRRPSSRLAPPAGPDWRASRLRPRWSPPARACA